tara:strand:- start:10964 stop:11506 length:543 start_codon:yes stop_codon:yes gene_type:complete
LDNYFKKIKEQIMKSLLLAMILSFSVSTYANVKVGIVNIQKIIVTIKEGKSVDSTLKKSFASKQKKIQAMEADIKDMQEKLQKQSKVLSDSAKAKKMEEINKKVMEARAQMNKYQKEIQKQEADLKKPILEKLKPIIDDISKDEGVAMTFEISSNPVVYAQNKVDLTDKVIKAYDKKHSK